MQRLLRNLLFIAVMALLGMAISRFAPFRPGPEPLGYSQFLRLLEGGSVRSVTLRGHRLLGVRQDPVRGPVEFTTAVPAVDAAEGQLIERLAARALTQPGFEFDAPEPAISEPLRNVFVSVLIPLLAIIALWILFWRQAQATGGRVLYTYPNAGDLRDAILADDLARIKREIAASQGRAHIQEKMEQTFVMIKPDGVRRGLVGECLRRFEARGLKIVQLKLLTPGRELAERHYGAHRDKPFFAGVVQFITSGRVVAMVLEGESAVAAVRQMVGATRPLDAAPGSIRGDFALDVGENIVHASDGSDTAAMEIALWFGEE